ncbi:pitrilysin family protein [Roseivirga sp. E12]|uniref:M16 family metallopeptidase n=1 Tax=Roseivirga sp. E12 TaxID=2819237 RepID=UPI001ABD16F5|nr:pitrilysin family protein [Roseivirga sp. E12]MBO3700825.1 insulinase family protein [Roseivirga sp. E12]
MTLDRTTPPLVRDVADISLPDIQSFSVNGIHTHAHLDKGSGTFKIELLSKGSQLYSKTSALSQLAIRMLNEGTASKSSADLAEAVDSIGSFLEITPGFDYATISIYGLAKYFEENLQILSELIYQPAFSKVSLENLKNREVDKLKTNLEKSSYISSINLRKGLFGVEHAYGKHLLSNELLSVTTEDVRQFHKANTQTFDIYVAGDLPVNFDNLLNRYFDTSNSNSPTALIGQVVAKPQNDTYQDSKFVQSSIKFGKRLFNRSHEDYFKFIVLNELLGGFFGSRLMKNIREDKGFTYGIHSNLYSLLHDGYFLIGTDVNKENEQETVDEVFKEVKLLQTALVANEELDTVKNYMIGVFINSFSSPFASIDKFKTLHSQGIDRQFYSQYISSIKDISAVIIREAADKYLQPDSLTLSIAGA